MMFFVVVVQLLQHLHCADKKAVEKLVLSRFTVARYGLTICGALSLETKQLMTESVARYTFVIKLTLPLPPPPCLLSVHFYYSVTPAYSLSIVFDEASDINMNGNLNVFVNVCLYNGEVRTLTLELQGIVTYTNPMTSYLFILLCCQDYTIRRVQGTQYSTGPGL
jgi:hypothetical protein